MSTQARAEREKAVDWQPGKQFAGAAWSETREQLLAEGWLPEDGRSRLPAGRVISARHYCSDVADTVILRRAGMLAS
jgi:hypothetical protein